jgi:ribonuclease HI
MIELYSDGSSAARSNKPIGWGWVLVVDGKYKTHGYGGLVSGSNNVAELIGAINGLWHCYDHKLKGVTLVADSQYVLNSSTGLWVAKKNLELVQHLQMLAKYLKIQTRWVPGHKGHQWNELADRLANRGKRRAKLGFYG